MSRYKVAVCDDDSEQLNNLCNLIVCALEDKHAGFDLARFLSGEDITDAIVRQGKKFDILFLDILMDELSGVEAARFIRGKDKDVSIVFITSSPDFVFEGYDVHALHYILKPVDRKKLESVLTYDFGRKFGKNYIDIKLSDSVGRIPFDDIVYLESKGRKVSITTTSGNYETYGTLRQLAEQLPQNRFISCHKSFLVNLDHVTQIARKDFVTATGQTIPISKTCYPDAKTAFINFIGKVRF